MVDLYDILDLCERYTSNYMPLKGLVKNDVTV